MLVAVDTNVLFALAEPVDAVVDAVATIRERIAGVRFVVPPTPLHEVALMALRADTAEKQKVAQAALTKLRNEWHFEPTNLVPVGHGIVERIADALREHGLIPVEERHDALLLAEAALLDCRILLTSDAHLRGVDFERLTLLLQGFDVAAPVIATPREIVRKFCR
jgi:predicted nucleic acid-binding protein